MLFFLSSVFIILLPFASAYARVGNVMMFCMFRLGFFSPLLFCFCYCINLYSFYYTQGSRMRREAKEIFFPFSQVMVFLFRSLLVPGRKGLRESFYTSHSFLVVGNFSTINVSTNRKWKHKTPERIKFSSAHKMMIISSE